MALWDFQRERSEDWGTQQTVPSRQEIILPGSKPILWSGKGHIRSDLNEFRHFSTSSYVLNTMSFYSLIFVNCRLFNFFLFWLLKLIINLVYNILITYIYYSHGKNLNFNMYGIMISNFTFFTEIQSFLFYVNIYGLFSTYVAY